MGWGSGPPPGGGLRRLVSPQPDALPAKGREQQLSNRSIVSLADSHTEFFDACEVLLSASSSENEVGRGWDGVGLCNPPPLSLFSCFWGFISHFSLPCPLTIS